MNELVRAPPALPDAEAFPRNLGRDRLIHRSFRRRDAEPKPCRHLAPLAWRHERCPRFPVAQCLVDRRRSMARRHPDEARHSRAAHPQYRSSLCRGHNVRQSFTQAAPCGPARASLLTGLYQMNHRAVQNTIPLDARFTTTGPDDPRFFVLGGIMDGLRPVGVVEPYKEAISPGWRARGTSCLKRTGRACRKRRCRFRTAAIVPENQSKSASSAL